MPSLYALKRWMYPQGRPNPVARFLNRIAEVQHRSGLAPQAWVTLEVPGRRSGRTVACPLVVLDSGGSRYLVGMLGPQTNWARNVRAAGGHAVLRHGGREAVVLTEVPAADRPPILRDYLEVAPGARPHFPVHRGASVEAFVPIAGDYPVFRVTQEPP